MLGARGHGIPYGAVVSASPRVLVLVGMSGVGKSFQAARLRERAGARVLDCDAEIAERLSEIVTPEPGEPPVVALGRWMGLPSSRGYREREARYLALEEEITASAIERAAAETGRVVIDTTGSVVHLSDAVLGALRAAGQVVYLHVPPEEHETMLAAYLREPKPVVFGDAWRPDGLDALARSYAALLRSRDERYRALAHRVLDARSLDAEGAALADALGW